LGAPSFSGLSILVFLGLVYPMLQVSLDCLFLFFFVLCTQCCKLLWIVYSCKTKTNKNRQSREACNIGYTRRRKTRMDNPEKLVTLGTEDEDKQE
jgi:cbb3-type cytochrome oxidase subunit 3